MEFFCLLQILLVWSHWAWSRGKYPQSKSPLPPSITPTGPPNARVSTTRRTAGRPPMTPSGSGYRSVVFAYIRGQGFVFFVENSMKWKMMSHWPSFQSLISKCAYAHSLTEKRCSSVWTWLYRWDLAHIWSEYCSLICTTSLHVTGPQKEKKNISQRALFIEICLSSTVDISYLHWEIWRSGLQSLNVEIE